MPIVVGMGMQGQTYRRALGHTAGGILLLAAAFAFADDAPPVEGELPPPPPPDEEWAPGVDETTPPNDEAEQPPADAPPAEPEPPTLRLSVKECIALAVANNLDAKVSVQQTRTADADLQAAWGPFDPTPYLRGTYTDSQVPVGNALSGISGVGLSESHQFQSAAGVRQRILWTGLQYDVGMELDRTRSNNSFALINPAWEVRPIARVSQPLLRGFGTVANLAAIRLARASQGIALDKFRTDLTEIVFQVENAYYDLVNAIKQREVRQKSLKLAETLLEVNRQKVRVGTLPPIEELQAEAQVASQQEGIITAQKAIEDAEDVLKRLIRPTWRDATEWDARVVPTDELVVGGPAPNTEEAIREALDRRPDYTALSKQVGAQEITIDQKENDLLPLVNVEGLYRQTGLGNDTNAAFDELRQDQPEVWSVTLSLEYPLGNHTARGELKKAEVERRRLALTMKSLEQVIVAEVREGVRGISTTAKRIQAAKKSTELATKQLEAEQKRYELGVSTSFQVLQFQEDLVNAEQRETQAFVDHRKALLRLQKATGKLLEDNGVVVDPGSFD